MKENYPKAGKKVFITWKEYSKDIETEGGIAYTGSKEQHPFVYVLAYKRAADELFEHARRRPYLLDTIVFPVIFLYRHYLELAMKWNGNPFLDKIYKVYSQSSFLPPIALDNEPR